jgi:hypothetical protein
LVDTTRIVRDGALLSVVASTWLLLLLRFNPRIFLGHFPKEIREIVPPRSKKERRMSILLGLLIGAPLASALLWRTATLGSHSFWELFAYAFGVLFIFNLVDLLILDWLIVCMAAEKDVRMFVQEGCFTIHSDQLPLNRRQGGRLI